MAIGDRYRIVTEKEHRIMSPPRRPPGEKPHTTIRFLQRQQRAMVQLIADLRTVCSEKDKQIARQDLELSEAADREHILMGQVENGADAHGRLLAAYQKNATRLSFLEGYYEKSTEALPHDPTKTHRGSGPGNQENIPNGSSDSAEERFEAVTRRARPRTGGAVQGFSPDHPAYSDRRSVAELEIVQAHNATDAELARHRR